MLKKFLDGLIFGSGFGVALVIIMLVTLNFVLPISNGISYGSKTSSSAGKELSTVPSIKIPDRFLGSPSIRSGGFNKEGILANGPGVIVGDAKVNGKPLKGLKLRLALNGSVLSQWAITTNDGKYNIGVPIGEYIIDGYELDFLTANNVLPNKITHPQSPHSSSKFKVAKGLNGRGLHFKFVDPISKNFSNNKYSADEEIILEWNEYPGASQYTVQITEKSDPYTWSNNTLFEWSEMPELLKPRINLKDLGVKLKPGHFYVVDIKARDNRMGILSESVRKHSGFDFEIIK